jgi:hypothetical protein
LDTDSENKGLSRSDPANKGLTGSDPDSKGVRPEVPFREQIRFALIFLRLSFVLLELREGHGRKSAFFKNLRASQPISITYTLLLRVDGWIGLGKHDVGSSGKNPA